MYCEPLLCFVEASPATSFGNQNFQVPMDEEILLGAACPPSRKRKASTTLQPEITQKRNTQKVSPLVVLPLSVVTPEEEDILLQEVWIMFGGPPPSTFFSSYSSHQLLRTQNTPRFANYR
jgi:hypothetical protein